MQMHKLPTHVFHIHYIRRVFMLIRIINGDNKIVTPTGRSAVCIENQYPIFISGFKCRGDFAKYINSIQKKNNQYNKHSDYYLQIFHRNYSLVYKCIHSLPHKEQKAYIIEKLDCKTN